MQSSTTWLIETKTLLCTFNGPINWDAFYATLEAGCTTLETHTQRGDVVLDVRELEALDMDAIHHLRRTAQIAAHPTIGHIAIVARGAFMLTMFNVFLRLYTPVAHKFRLVSSPEEALTPQIA